MRAVIELVAIFVLDLFCLISLGANGQFSPPFRFDGFPPPEPTRSSSLASSESLDTSSSPSTVGTASNSSLVWQPLRATFRPLNRPAPPTPPVRPTPPAPPVPLALSLGTEPIPSSPSSSSSSSLSDFASSTSIDGATRPGSSSFGSDLSTTGFASDLAVRDGSGSSFATGTSGGPTPAPSVNSNRDTLDNEDLPTRVPLNRFRPTKAPSNDPQSQPTPSPPATGSGSFAGAAIFPSATTSRSQNLTSNLNRRHITSECLECICEASTNCNPNSRCQTSDVRHTRCGMFLISYNQWLETGLSRELVSSEALARDAAADERAFYECVTNRDCAERLLTIYAHKHSKDCDKDGRINCYDMAAVHQGGLDGCQGEALLDSQYWSDFNACFGFGR